MMFPVFCLLFYLISVSQQCTQYKVKSLKNYYSVSINYYYGCGWLNLGICEGTYYYVTFYVTYSIVLECCSGYGGDECLPICSDGCGLNMQCTSPETCTCTPGWTGHDCLTDVDECSNGDQLCEVQDLCDNRIGTYECSCNDPDILADDGRRCLNQVRIWAMPFQQCIELSWLPSDDYLQDGEFLQYNISCFPNSTVNQDSNSEFEIIIDSADNTSIDVYPLTPFTTYTCCVTMQWVLNGVGPPNCTTTQTLQDIPDGPPENVEVLSIDSSILFIQWDPPSTPNGIIISYTLYIDYSNYSKIHHQEVEGNARSFLLQFLHSYQLVGISISATTEAGEGPSSSFEYNHTMQTRPGAVHNLKAISISPYVVNITWNPPNLPNGIITMYKITLKSLLSNDMLHQWAVSPNNALSVIASNLEPFIRYEVEVEAANAAGKGITTPFKFYTLESVPMVPPKLISTNRTSAVTALCQWEALTLEELRGFLLHYVVKYSSSCNYTHEDSINTTETNATLTSLNPHNLYCFKVAAATAKGVGDYSQWININVFESSSFELIIFGLQDCKEWVDENVLEKIKDVQQTLAEVVIQYCHCEIQPSYFKLNFVCDNRMNDIVIVQGRLVGTPNIGSNLMVNGLKQWINATGDPQPILIQQYQLYIDPNCDITNASNCLYSRTEIPTSNYIAALIGAIISILITIAVLSLLGGLILSCTRRKKKGRPPILKEGDEMKRVVAINPIIAEEETNYYDIVQPTNDNAIFDS